MILSKNHDNSQRRHIIPKFIMALWEYLALIRIKWPAGGHRAVRLLTGVWRGRE